MPEPVEIVVAEKAWYTSKTIWFNVITFATTVLSLGDLQGMLSPSVLKVALLGISVANLALRYFFTDGPIKKL